MAMIIKEISAAVDEKNNVPVIVAKQKDFKSRFINVRLINSGGFMKIQKNANVYDWALSSSKPDYQTSEIKGLDTKLNDLQSSIQKLKWKRI